MDLMTTLPQKQTAHNVLVNGTVYKVDETGVCRGVKDEDAQKMLDGAWEAWDGRDPRQHSEERRQARLKALKAQREKEQQQRPSQVEFIQKLEEKIKARLLAEGWTPPAPDTEEPPPEVDEEKPDAPVSGDDQTETDEVEDPPIPSGEDEEWSDPDESYSMEWLKACADAYEVQYAANIGKKTLVGRIKKAMYE